MTSDFDDLGTIYSKSRGDPKLTALADWAFDLAIAEADTRAPKILTFKTWREKGHGQVVLKVDPESIKIRYLDEVHSRIDHAIPKWHLRVFTAPTDELIHGLADLLTGKELYDRHVRAIVKKHLDVESRLEKAGFAHDPKWGMWRKTAAESNEQKVAGIRVDGHADSGRE